MDSVGSAPYLAFDFVGDDECPRRLVFSHPVEIISTNSMSAVRSCLRDVQIVVGIVQLAEATDLWLINSLRGWVPVSLEARIRL